MLMTPTRGHISQRLQREPKIIDTILSFKCISIQKENDFTKESAYERKKMKQTSIQIQIFYALIKNQAR
jgi:hypothetical protein